MDSDRHQVKRRELGLSARKGKDSDDYIGQFQVVYDPDDTWGRMSCLDRADVMLLLNKGYLTPGTRFKKRQTGEVYEIQEVKVYGKPSRLVMESVR
jgi:hypothetical protein